MLCDVLVGAVWEEISETERLELLSDVAGGENFPWLAWRRLLARSPRKPGSAGLASWGLAAESSGEPGRRY
jgi:1,6-anhydro-N-acetylmuramate kinase